MKFSAIEIAKILNGEIEGDSSVDIDSLNKIEESTNRSITFLANKKYEPWVYRTKASIIIVNKNFEPTKDINATLIRVEDSYMAFVKLLHKFDTGSISSFGIKDSAIISKTVKIEENVSVGNYSTIGENVILGKNVIILNNVNICDNVSIGSNTIVHPGAVIYKDCEIGENCVIHSNVVVGSDGFGFAPDDSGKFKKVPQIGNVIIKDNVEIGASSTIDRATLGSTIINSGVKLDNLVQIAHNVVIGENTVMAAQCGIAGSTKIGKNCQIGGHVGMVGHITIGDNVKINGKACVFKSVKDGSVIKGSPAFEERAFNKSYVHFKNLDKYVKDIENLKNSNDSSN
ncbi:MAG: UDP-3-O-(3-hydroxymyristoyl)glucosamine N-acyltransferase [Bacteroidota bacterium]|nr:UDP-3-O-(3-hydroxymyristoyl)glucosamine N-acyltransferase [Bacteroidota bacterium]